MAMIRLSLTEIVTAIRQNVDLPSAISRVEVKNNEISITTVYGLTFLVSYKSYLDEWLELEINGRGFIGKIITATLGAKLLDILAPRLIDAGAARTQGQSVFLDIRELLRDFRGLRIEKIRTDGTDFVITAAMEVFPGPTG